MIATLSSHATQTVQFAAMVATTFLTLAALMTSLRLKGRSHLGIVLHMGRQAIWTGVACSLVFACFGAALAAKRSAPAEAVRADMHFETAALGALERLAGGVGGAVPIGEGAVASDRSRFSVQATAAGVVVRFEDVTRASCAAVLQGLSPHAQALLDVTKNPGSDGVAGRYGGWLRDCPTEGTTADLLLSRRVAP